MNIRKELVLLPVFALILAACSPQGQAGTPSGTGESGEESLTSSLLDLMNLGKNQKCTWETVDEDGSTTGTIYISGKKFRQEIMMRDEAGTESTTDAISDGTYIYMWGSADPTNGLKMNLAETAEDSDTVPTGTVQSNPVELDEDLNYRCSGWGVDGSKFNLPAGVTFTDLSEMMKTFQQQMPSIPSYPSYPAE